MNITKELEQKLISRLGEVLKGDGDCSLKHKNGRIEHLIVGEMNDCIFIYNEEPNLIRAFEVEGSGARDANIADAAVWLYVRSFSA